MNLIMWSRWDVVVDLIGQRVCLGQNINLILSLPQSNISYKICMVYTINDSSIEFYEIGIRFMNWNDTNCNPSCKTVRRDTICGPGSSMIHISRISRQHTRVTGLPPATTTQLHSYTETGLEYPHGLTYKKSKLPHCDRITAITFSVHRHGLLGCRELARKKRVRCGSPLYYVPSLWNYRATSIPSIFLPNDPSYGLQRWM